jgi:hypothetical protein
VTEFFSPTGSQSPQAARLAPRLDSLEGKSLGIVDNGKPNGDRFLGIVAELLQERYGVKEVHSIRKESISRPAPADLIADMAARSHLVITGIGD